MQTRYLVVGGGITGLSFAESVHSDDYIVCEALSDVGGYCQTVKQDGFVWDYSGHFFHFRNKDIEQHLVGRIGRDKVRTVVKESRIYYKDKLIDFPFQKNIHQLPYDDFIDCLVGLFERDEKSMENFKSMLYARFGQGISDRFLVPYNEKLYATDLARLDVNAMGRFFPYADVSDIIRGFRRADNSSYNSSFTYPEGGAVEYVRATQAGVKAENILLNEPVERIDLRRRVAHTKHRQIQFEYLINSMPFPKLLDLIGMPYDPQVYSYNKVLVFNLGFDSKGARGMHWVYFPERSLSFYRIGFYDNIFDTDRMSLYVEIGYPADAVLTAEDIDRMRERVLSDLKLTNIVQQQKLVSWHHIVLDPAYVHITQSSLHDVAQKKDILAANGVYSLGRYGSWTYCSIEDNIIEARDLASKFNAVHQL